MDLARSALLACLPVFGACRSMHSEQADQMVTLAFGSGAQGSGGWSSYGEPWIASFAYGVEPHDWPCGIEVGAQVGGAEGPQTAQPRDLEFSELWFGAARTWKPVSWLRLQGGAGLRFAQAHLMGPGFIFDEQVDSDTSPGVYAHLGAFAHLAGPFSAGLDARWADGSDFTLENLSRDSQLMQLLLALRWDF